MTTKDLLNVTLSDKMSGIWVSGDEMNGEYKEWFGRDSFLLKRHYFHKDGQLHGMCKMWYSDGAAMEFGFYKEGNRHGIFRTWDYSTKGDVFQLKNYYEMGVLISLE